MKRHLLRRRHLPRTLVVAALSIGLGSYMQAQGRGTPAAPVVAQTSRGLAPIDLTGNWVSVITEDWRFRMVTPPKGDYGGVPLNLAARKLADVWDPRADEAAGEQCRSFGAPGIMRMPTRLRIGWTDDSTLKVETDAGMQTRLLHFGAWSAPSGAATWQGNSIAQWESIGSGRGVGGPRPPGITATETRPVPQTPAKFGSLKVVTTAMRPGYLRKNGIPYSAATVLTEYWDLYARSNGERWFVLTAVVNDPEYLQRDWITSLNFRKEPDGSKWDPTPCSATW